MLLVVLPDAFSFDLLLDGPVNFLIQDPEVVPGLFNSHLQLRALLGDDPNQ